MPKTIDPISARLDLLLAATQNLFILEALRAGMNVEDVRKLLKVDKWRISKISKPLKQAARKGSAT
jgi:hypothetical protein